MGGKMSASHFSKSAKCNLRGPWFDLLDSIRDCPRGSDKGKLWMMEYRKSILIAGKCRNIMEIFKDYGKQFVLSWKK